ncbi:unnamed protein product [Linum trigynum]|uniref:GDSL esterase/lipase 6 n=1 Tax=Linum trigynum TaxID=586398 RepID=A0AAV2E768_9ROSI
MTTAALGVYLACFSCALGLVAPATVFTFGDSIFDGGNNHFKKKCTAQADFPPYGSSYFHYPTGRFTNGRTVVDFICQFMGMGLQMPFLEAQSAVLNGSWKSYPSNGLNFASAGSGVLSATNQDLGVTAIEEQLQQFEALIQEKQFQTPEIRQSIFLLESGSNDIFNYFLPLAPPSLDPDAMVRSMLAQVSSFISRIYRVGGRRIAVFSLGPVGCVPARALLPGAPLDKCYEEMNSMVRIYNSGLEDLVKGVPANYPGAVAVFGDVFHLVERFREDPPRYGFKDVRNACCGEGTLGGMVQCGKEGYKECGNPREYMFWDYFHPSEHTYSRISKALWAGRNSTIRPFNLHTLFST